MSEEEDFHFEFFGGEEEEEGEHTYHKAIDRVLTRTEEEINERGWDQFPLQLFVVQMGWLAGMTSFSLTMPKDLPDFSNDPPRLLAAFVVSVVAEEAITGQVPEHIHRNRKVTWLDDMVDRGFLGWVSVTEAWAADSEDPSAKEFYDRGELEKYPDVKEQRMVVFVDLAGNVFIRTRVRDQEPFSQQGTVGPNPEEGGMMTMGVVPNCHTALNVASVWSLKRRYPVSNPMDPSNE